MNFLDEDAPAPKRRLLLPPALDALGVDELALYIADLEAEILRVKARQVRGQRYVDAGGRHGNERKARQPRGAERGRMSGVRHRLFASHTSGACEKTEPSSSITPVSLT